RWRGLRFGGRLSGGLTGAGAPATVCNRSAPARAFRAAVRGTARVPGAGEVGAPGTRRNDVEAARRRVCGLRASRAAKREGVAGSKDGAIHAAKLALSGAPW